MSNSTTLAEFLVEIGFMVKDHDKIQSAVKNTEKDLTATTEAGAAARVAVDRAGHQSRIDTAKQAGGQVTRVHANEIAKQGLISDDAAKRDRIRRTEQVKQMEQFALQASSFATGLAKGLSGVLSAVPFGGFIAGVKGVADSYSQLAIQAQRTRSTPRGLLKYQYAFRQAGVSEGEADASIENFSGRLRSAPEAYLGLLRQFGVKTTDDRGNTLTSEQLMENLGQGLAEMPLNLAQRRGDQLGLGVNTVNALRDQKNLQEQVARADAKFTAFGFDPDKAAGDARNFDQAYDNLAADLKISADKIGAQFFKPLTDGFNSVATWMEKNPEQVDNFGKALVAFSAVIAARVIPVVASLTLRMTGLTSLFSSLPPVLLAALGYAGANTLATNTIDPNRNLADESTGEAVMRNLDEGLADRIYGKRGEQQVHGPHHGVGVHANHDQRNLWQRTMPKWLGGKDAPTADSGTYPTGPVDASKLNWSSMSRDTAAKRVVLANYAKELGLPDHSAAAMVGHSEVESNFKTDAHNGRLEDSTGLFQLNDSAAAGFRHSKYLAWAKENGRSPADWKAQMDYGKFEAQHRAGPNGMSVWDAMKKAGSLEEANQVWMDYFEQPKYRDYNNRAMYGRRALAALHSQPAPSSGSIIGSAEAAETQRQVFNPRSSVHRPPTRIEPTLANPLPHPLSQPVRVELTDRSAAHLGDRVRGAVSARSAAAGDRLDAANAEDRMRALHQHLVELAKHGRLDANYLMHGGHRPIHLGGASIVSHGDRVFNRSGDTFHVTGSNVSQNLDAAQKLSARRASEDRVRFMEGSQQ